MYYILYDTPQGGSFVKSDSKKDMADQVLKLKEKGICEDGIRVFDEGSRVKLPKETDQAGNPHKDCLGRSHSLSGSLRCLRGEDGTFRLMHGHEVNEDECRDCPHYKSKYIQYPIEVGRVSLGSLETRMPQKKSTGPLVAVRVAGSEGTHLGFYLGDLPWFLTATYNEDTKELSVSAPGNPAFFVPALNRIVRGAESWWSPVKSPDDLRMITDEEINNQWYVQLAKLVCADQQEGRNQ